MNDSGLAFGCYWKALNEELKLIGQTEALFGDARYWFERNYSPNGAASMIADDRAMTAAMLGD